MKQPLTQNPDLKVQPGRTKGENTRIIIEFSHFTALFFGLINGYSNIDALIIIMDETEKLNPKKLI